MTDLSTTYLGLSLANPVVVAACSLSSKVDSIKRVEESGAGAMVIKSLFEEQILHEIVELDDALDVGSESFAESLTYFPHLEHAGAKEHLMWVESARKAVKMPLIGSLNAVNPGKWADYARQLADTGVDALELNVYAVEADLSKTAADVESRMLDTVSSVRNATSLPLSVKLSPFYTSVGNVIRQVESRGAQGAVLFNRFLQPTIDPGTETLVHKMTFSTPQEMCVPLRWIALLYGKTGIDLAANTGAMEAVDVCAYILAGANVVQVASTLYKNGIEHISTLVSGVKEWMNAKGYQKPADFRGKVSQAHADKDPHVFERAQYVQFLMSQQKWQRT